MSFIAPRIRRLFRFSLATLLLLMTVFAVWLGSASYQAQEQARAVIALSKAGAEINYDYQRTSLASYSYKTKPPGPQWLREAIGEDYFRRAVAVRGGVTDQTSVNLETLRQAA
jgi:hypothetical protein